MRYYRVREAYQACIKPGDSNLYIKTDATNTARVLDCPYRPSNTASGYPGQACYGGMIANNAAVDTGLSIDSKEFPVPKCGSSKKVITCGSLKKRFAPNADFSGCVEVAHEAGLFYDSKDECERDCVNKTGAITASVLSKPGFCDKVPLCSTGYQVGSRPVITSAYACFLCNDGGCSYTLIPPPENVSCSTILRRDPTNNDIIKIEDRPEIPF